MIKLWIGAPVMYRYHRPSRNVKGQVIGISTYNSKVTVKMNDGEVIKRDAESFQLVGGEDAYNG